MRLLLAMALLISAAACANIQEKIYGTVSNSQGQPLAGAIVTAENIGLNKNFSINTDSDGFYQFEDSWLQIFNGYSGSSEVKITAILSGYQNFETTVTIVGDEDYILDITLTQWLALIFTYNLVWLGEAEITSYN